jgi:AraC family transcriptional regulator of adaptative response / DNA-3-methyladenine glycosylase II
MDMDRTACYRAISTRDARFDGRLFVGVKTTGIYCRPICPARTPKFENVSFYPSAAAAQEAGFRPCLRCRPETSPDLAFWRGTSNTVSRALALIEAGGLDGADVEGLAGRLGVGARQLRRLFRQHVGASPIAVAQTRRVLLAKQLIHESRLPMAQVALASGFNSVRRFNETFQQLFGRPPASLRRIRGKERDSHEGGALTVHLAYRPPYDWTAMLTFLAARAIPGVEVVANGVYRRSIAVGSDSGVLSVAGAGRNRVAVTLRFPNMAALPTIIARVRRVFDLAADPDMIGGHLSLDPVLAPLVAARPGLRVPGAWDGFELAVRAIFGQQITVPAATRLLGRLVEAHGAVLPEEMRDEGLIHVFPSPARLAGVELGLGMPRARAVAVTSLAGALADDPSIFSPGASLEAAITKLRALPGIGEWTAQYIAMRELREPDAFPAADIGLMRAMATSHGARPTPAELLALAERWRPWRAYAALHLWASAIDYDIPTAKVRHEREAA